MSLWQIIRRLVPFVKPYRRWVIFSLGLTLLGAFAAQVNPVVLRYTVDTIERLLREGRTASQGTSLLLLISAVLLGKEILNTGLRYGQNLFGEKIRVNVSSRLSQFAVEKILTYRLAFYSASDNQTGILQTRIDRGAESLTKLVQSAFIDILPLFANAILALVIMFLANVYVGLVAAAILPVYFLLSQRQASMLKGARRGLRALREEKNNGLHNIIESIVVIKSFVREEYEKEKQVRLQQNLVRAQLKQRQTNFIFDGLKTFVEQIGVVLIIILTAYLVLDLRMSIGAIMFHIMLFGNVSAPIRQLHRIYDEMNDALTYAEGYFQILDADDEIEPSGDLGVSNLQGAFELIDVSFTYPNGTQALYNVNMKIPHGKTVAFVGLSGAGKSTLLNLLTRFYTPTGGRLLLDGHDISEYKTDLLRRKIGLVLQKNHIFKGTIEENIRYGNIDATPREVEEAARKAYLTDQIEGLPNKYQSDAQLLSGGQQQRIAIARLFLKDPPIIFLDEPTASLDAIATEQIKNSLDAIKADRTTVVISHSISQIIDADIIFVLKEGRVVEHGTHEDLYERDGTYREIFNASARSLNIDKISRTLDVELTSAPAN
ncbi:MAG TPA: ABC transporter ATP-binding protein [Pyrinomonadaceae bacterium]|jgi:ABC-type multidrug transport system fused ATPase/permease subunit|nr:ABC transporter ATP-binding protein [Pyrinomonadaceae bacterium]